MVMARHRIVDSDQPVALKDLRTLGGNLGSIRSSQFSFELGDYRPG